MRIRPADLRISWADSHPTANGDRLAHVGSSWGHLYNNKNQYKINIFAFGSHLVAFGPYLVPCGPHLVPLGPHLAPLGPYLVPTWSHLVGPIVPFAPHLVAT